MSLFTCSVEHRWTAIGVSTGRRMDVEGIRQANEQVEQCSIVDRFGHLLISPSGTSQLLHLTIGNSVGVPGKCAHKVEQEPFRGRDWNVIEWNPLANRVCNRRVLFALQLQEPRMATESVMAPGERGHVGRDHFVLCAR